jgi:membrane protease YdiL (CAAX protease family)
MLPEPISDPLGAPLAPVEPPQIVPPPARNPFWSYWDLLLLLGFVCAGILAILIVAVVIEAFSPALRKDPTPLALPLQFLFYAAVYAGFVAVFRLRYNRRALPSLGWVPSGINPLFAAVGGIVLAIVLSLLGQALHTPETNFIDRLVHSWFSFALLAATAVIVAPFFEELLFRGFLQPLLSRTFGVAAGVLITAALFGSLHLFQYSLAWQYAIIIFLAGVAFGWVRARTGSVIPGTLMHCCFNSVSVVAYYISARPNLR